MFEVVFYETREGKSEVWDFMEELRIRSSINKTKIKDYLERNG